MEVLAMAPTEHVYSDPSYTGQAPNMFLTNVGRQQGQDPRSSLFAVAGGQFVAHGPGTLSSHSTDFSEEPIDSPHMSNVSWEDFAATSWEEHARMLEQQGAGHRALHLPQNSMRFTSAPTNAGFRPNDLVAASTAMTGGSAMDYSLSTSVSPGPEMISPDTFTSPLTPSSFVPDTNTTQSQQNQQNLPQTRHRHMQSTPSPSRDPDSIEIARRRSAPTQPKSASGSSNKVNKANSRPASSQAPANSRSAHSAIERKYRENINSKIGELHKVLCAAAPPIFPDQETEPGGYPYGRVQRPEDDEEGMEGMAVPGQTTLSAKKADVLAGAVAYVKRSEREKQALKDQLAAAYERLGQYEHMMAQARARSLG